jgi:hypothetical protein
MPRWILKIGMSALIATLMLALFVPFSFAQQEQEEFDPTKLFRKFEYTNQDTTGTKIGAVAALPDASWQAALTSVIKILLNITGAIALIAFTAGGVMMVVSNGNSDTLDRGKKVVIYAMGGLIVIAVSYAIVIGVSELQFFTPGTATNESSGSTDNSSADTGSIESSGPGGSSSGSTDE